MKNLIAELTIQTSSKERQRLEDWLKNISIKHRVLAEQIFYLLYESIIEIKTYVTGLLDIQYTGSHIKESLHYDNVLKHLECIPNFLTQLKQLKDKIHAYTIDRFHFYDERLPNYISSYIQQNGFRSSTDINNNDNLILLCCITKPH